MEQVQLSISPAQMTKIKKGLPIQIKHGSMGNGDMVIAVHPDKAKKMMSAYKRGKGLRITMDENEVRASGLLDGIKRLGKKVERTVVDAGNTVAKPAKKVISQIPKPFRDVLQDEGQGLIDTTGTTLGTMIATATGDEELGEMVSQGISDTGNELLSGQKLSLGSKILPIAKRSVNVVVDQIEDPRYKAIAKQIVKKSGAGLYGKAGAGLTGRGLSGSGLSGSGMRQKRLAVMRPAVMPPPNFIEESGKMYTQPHKPKLPKPRFEKGSQEAKDYMSSIRNNKEGSGFFKNLAEMLRR